MFNLLPKKAMLESLYSFVRSNIWESSEANVPTDRDTVVDEESVVTSYSKGAMGCSMGCAFRLVIISLRQTGNFLTVNLSCSFVNFFYLGGKIREVNLALKCQIIRSSYCRKLFAERSSREIDVFLFGKKTCQRNFFNISRIKKNRWSGDFRRDFGDGFGNENEQWMQIRYTKKEVKEGGG